MALFQKKKSTEITFSYEKKVLIPKTAQDTIPFIEAYDNGIFLVDNNVFTIIFSFENIDYNLLREEEQREIYEGYMRLLNALPTDISYQEFIMNDKVNTTRLRSAMLPPPNNGEYSPIHENFTEIMEERVLRSEAASADKLMLIALSYSPQTSVDNATVLFKYYHELQTYFEHIRVGVRQLMPEEVFSVLYKYYHPFDESAFLLPADFYSRGHRIKDYIAPSVFAFRPKQVEVGESFCRVLYVSRYDRDLDDEFINDLLDNNMKVVVSKHAVRMDKSAALSTVKTEIFNVQTQIQKRMEDNHKKGGNFIPFRLQEKLAELEDLQGRLSGSTLELFDIAVFISLSAKTMDELEELTTSIKTKANKHQVLLNILTRQQEKGMNSILPFAQNHFNNKNGNTIGTHLLTDAAGILIPFSYCTYFTENGICYGTNRVTNSAIILDRTDEMNSNGFVYGTSGSGKSMFTKLELTEVALKNPKDELIVIDPEDEYRAMVQPDCLDGEILKISADSDTTFNLFDIDLSATEQGRDAISMKSEFIMSIIETIKNAPLEPTEQSLIDRCVRLSYHKFQQTGAASDLPTLTSFYQLLLAQSEPIAHDIAMILELYVTGSFHSFANQTSIQTSKRFLVIDISEMGEQLRKIGLQVVLEYIWQRVRANKKKGIRTWVWVDEFSIMFSDTENKKTDQSGKFFMMVYSRIRKYGGVVTAITQNVTDVLASKQAVSMMGNAEFSILLQQKSENLAELSRIFKLSPSQTSYLKSGEKGTGLIICGQKIVPFDKTIKREGAVYQMVSTDFKELQRSVDHAS